MKIISLILLILFVYPIFTYAQPTSPCTVQDRVYLRTYLAQTDAARNLEDTQINQKKRYYRPRRLDTAIQNEVQANPNDPVVKILPDPYNTALLKVGHACRQYLLIQEHLLPLPKGVHTR